MSNSNSAEESARQALLSYYHGETQTEKLARKSREAPFMVAGIGGCALACLYGIYKYKHRGTMSTSVYLMQLRVVAQGAVVTALSLGIGYSLFTKLFKKGESE